MRHLNDDGGGFGWPLCHLMADMQFEPAEIVKWRDPGKDCGMLKAFACLLMNGLVNPVLGSTKDREQLSSFV